MEVSVHLWALFIILLAIGRPPWRNWRPHKLVYILLEILLGCVSLNSAGLQEILIRDEFERREPLVSWREVTDFESCMERGIPTTLQVSSWSSFLIPLFGSTQIVWLLAKRKPCFDHSQLRAHETSQNFARTSLLSWPNMHWKGALNITVHLKSLFATCQQNLENARKTPGWHTSTSGRHGGDLVQQATQKLRNAPRRALATLESKLHEKQLLHSSNCQKVGNALEQFALYFHRFSTEAFLQLATGAASSVWAGDIQNSDVIYIDLSWNFWAWSTRTFSRLYSVASFEVFDARCRKESRQRGQGTLP